MALSWRKSTEAGDQNLEANEEVTGIRLEMVWAAVRMAMCRGIRRMGSWTRHEPTVVLREPRELSLTACLGLGRRAPNRIRPGTKPQGPLEA